MHIVSCLLPEYAFADYVIFVDFMLIINCLYTPYPVSLLFYSQSTLPW